MENFFVAGSSVFPTCSTDMPTLTIIALAHRLADRLKAEMLENRTLATSAS
jgi:choline dehydrogenase-like flavoprotein